MYNKFPMKYSAYKPCTPGAVRHERKSGRKGGVNKESGRRANWNAINKFYFQLNTNQFV